MAESSEGRAGARDAAAREALARLGWTGALERELSLATAGGAVPGRVVARHRDRWDVAIAAPGGGLTRVRATVAAGAAAVPEPPAVGDWVAVGEAGVEGRVGQGGASAGALASASAGAGRAAAGGVVPIVALLPRSGAFTRRAAGRGGGAQVLAANVDTALVLASLAEPLNPRRLERYATLAWDGGAVPVIVLTKLDEVSTEAPEPGEPAFDVAATLEAARGVAPGIDAVAVSARTGEGMAELERRLAPGSTSVLLGPSGVGKSTLLNRLLGEERQPTGGLRRDGKGRHTTTHRELFLAPSGAILIDTPGLREVGLVDSAEGLAAAFGDIETLADRCRFRDCAHDHEPGCAVRGAVEEGALAADRLESWHALRKELAFLERRGDPAAEAAERSRWKEIHRSMRVHLKRRYEQE